MRDVPETKLSDEVRERLQRDLAIVSKVRSSYDMEAGLRRFEAVIGAEGEAGAASLAAIRASRMRVRILLIAATLALGTGLSFAWSTAHPRWFRAEQVAPAQSSIVASSLISALAFSTSSELSARPEPSPASPPSTARPGSGRPTQEIATASASSPVSLAEAEITHLRQLRVVARSDPSSALRMAEEGHRKFASGMLYQEREALAIFALMDMGRTAEARQRAQAFLRLFPNSVFSSRMRQSLGLGTDGDR